MRVRNNFHAWAAVGVLALCCLAQSASAQVDTVSQAYTAAGRAIADYHRLCQHDGGRLWGKSLCGPIMLVNGTTRAIYADRNTPNHDLRAVGTLFAGTLPSQVSIANTSTNWAGIRWVMVLLPLPSERAERDTLLIHEAFHRIQPDRLPPPVAALPDHLDTPDGRIYLRLEWRALAQALRTHGEGRRIAIRDALAFRAFRRNLTPDAANEENALEILEGLAEYTGRRLGAGKDAVSSTIAVLANYDQRDGYVRSFAYASGPAYGLLLDRLSPRWRDKLRPNSDLGDLLHHAIGNTALPDVSSIRDGYGFAEIRLEEATKADVHARQAAHWQAVLVDGPVVRLPLAGLNIEFNPRNLFVLPPFGTVYPTAIIRDAWGTLTVRQGVLIAKDRKSASVSGPAVLHGDDYAGEGWSLKLSPGWIVSDGSIRRR